MFSGFHFGNVSFSTVRLLASVLSLVMISPLSMSLGFKVLRKHSPCGSYLSLASLENNNVSYPFFNVIATGVKKEKRDPHVMRKYDSGGRNRNCGRFVDRTSN